MSNIYFLITIHNVFVFVDSKNSVSVTIQDYTHVQMTDIIIIIIIIVCLPCFRPHDHFRSHYQ
jgi:hypothetical protein